tara:strand:- start:1557 stop:1781 length:225 start_codon:yes stop_codon:yes gene_type:complete
MALKFTKRFIQVISFYVFLTLLPLIAFQNKMLKNVLPTEMKVGDMYALLSVLAGVMWHVVGEGYVKTGKLNLSI